jgi:hypothetical protein
MGMEPKVLWRGATPLCRLPLAESEVQSVDKKWKRLEDLTSSGSSKPKDIPQEQSTSKDPPPTMFDLLDS